MTRLTERVRVTAPWWVLLATGLLGSLALVLSSSTIGSVPRPYSYRWWWEGPHLSYGAAHVWFYLGLTLLVASWVLLGAHARRGFLTRRTTTLFLAAWGGPLALGVPLFGRDVYSYAAQGTIAAQGLNPYHVAQLGTVHGVWAGSLAEVWRSTTSPYGPLWVLCTKMVAKFGGPHLMSQVFGFRILALASVAVMVLFVPMVARRLGADPSVALWIAVLSPLALASGMSSAHNDLLMLAFVSGAGVLAVKGRTRWAIAVFSLAATVKLPALAGALFVAIAAGAGLPWRVRLRRHLIDFFIAVEPLVIVTWLAGNGWVWLSPTALKIPTMLRIITTPSVCLGTFIASVLHLVGVSASTHTIVGYVQPLVELAGTVVLLALLRGLTPDNKWRRLGFFLLITVLVSPTVWPWYYLWGIVVLAMTGAAATSLVLILSAGIMLSVGPGGTPMLGGNGYLVVAPALVYGAWYAVRRGPVTRMLEGSDRA